MALAEINNTYTINIGIYFKLLELAARLQNPATLATVMWYLERDMCKKQ